jgi:hypothetical protein
MADGKKIEVKLRECKIEQFAGTKFLHIINPDPHLVKIAGPNRSGKSSTKAAIEVAHAGRDGKMPPDPVNDKEGAEFAHLYFDWTAFVTTCRVDSAGHKKLEVKDPEGVQVPKQQTLLNRALGNMWRPQEFLAKTDAEKLKIVESLTSQDWRDERDEIEADYQRAYAIRTAKNSARDNMGTLERVDEATRIDVDELNARIKAARENNQGEKTRANLWNQEQEQRARDIATAQRGVKAATEEIDLRRRRLDELIKDRASEQAALEALPAPETEAPPLNLQPLETMEAEFAQASATNEAAGAYERYLKDLDKRKAAVAAAEAADKKVKELSKARKFHAKEATLPDGLEVRDKGMYYNGRALGSMSRSEGAEFACSIAAAKGAKFMLVDDAEQFDDLSHLYKLAVKYDLQIFAFIRGDGDEGSGKEAIHLYMGAEFKGEVDAKGYPVIKDGEAIAVKPPAEEEPEAYNPDDDVDF